MTAAFVAALLAALAGLFAAGLWKVCQRLARWIGRHLKGIIVEALDEHVANTLAETLESIRGRLVNIERTERLRAAETIAIRQRLDAIERRSLRHRATDDVKEEGAAVDDGGAEQH